MNDLPEIIDEAEIAARVADLTRVVKWLASTKTATGETAAALERLAQFSEKIAKKETI
jgi:hypothetical protein